MQVPGSFFYPFVVWKEVVMKPTRYFGLDIHKAYLVAVAVDDEKQVVYGPRRVEWPQFERWIAQALTKEDAVVIEMTTNTWEVYDTLTPHVFNVLVVHPQHVKAIVDAQVKTDKKAAQMLAELLAAGLLHGIWVPDNYIRDLRMLASQRKKMGRLGATAKNRLHAVLHRHHIIPPEGFELFHPNLKPWWEGLRVSAMEKVRIKSDLATLEFAKAQKAMLEEEMGKVAAQDTRIPLLIQIPGVAMLTAVTILAAIGTITRFPDAKHLVGYAGLGARVHDSGERYTTGGITKMGRRDLRGAIIDAANAATRHHPYWKKEFERLQFRLGRSRAIVAIARRLLITVWHVLRGELVDKYHDPRDIACSLFRLAYAVKVRNLPNKQSAIQFTRNQLDRLGIGADIETIPWGTKNVKLPPSKLKEKDNK
jgi:transposase